MSLFSSIRKSRQQAKEHNAKIAEQKKKEDEDKTPYRHVPTHAATDAFASAPPVWRETSDLPKIAEQNRRRSAMSANGQPLNIPGPNIPRVGSTLSYVSYPGQSSQSSQSSFRARMPRAYSYNGVSPYPNGSRDIIYSIPDVAHSEPEGLGDTISESNNGSNSSQDNLEMKKSSKAPATGQSPAPAADRASRLHPHVHTRRMSDGASDGRAVSGTGVRKGGTSSPSRDSRPPSSTRGFNAIRPPATYVPLQVGKAPGPMPVEVIPSTVNGASNANASSSRQNSSTSLPEPVAVSSKPVLPSTTASPAPTLPLPSDYNLNSIDVTSDTNRKSSSETDTKPSTPQSKQTTQRPAPKTTRFRELDSSFTEAIPPPPPVQVVNFFPEPVAPEPMPSSKSKGKIFSKGGGSRLLKKDRRASIWAS